MWSLAPADPKTGAHRSEQSAPYVWFRDWARRELDKPLGSTELRLARFRAGSGWHRYVVRIEEQHLPSPNPGIADDRVPAGWRLPKDRAAYPVDG